jgi:YHS domain-containing protein
MNSLSRVFRAVLWGVVATGLLSLVRQWGASEANRVTHGQHPDQFSPAIRLYRDPVCGTYVSAEISVKLEKSGHITHFCSAECRERYERAATRAARA